MSQEFFNLCVLVTIVAVVWTIVDARRRRRMIPPLPPLSPIYTIRVEGMGVVFCGTDQNRAIAAFMAYRDASAGVYTPPRPLERSHVSKASWTQPGPFYAAEPYVLSSQHVSRSYLRSVQLFVNGVRSGIYYFRVLEVPV